MAILLSPPLAFLIFAGPGALGVLVLVAAVLAVIYLLIPFTALANDPVVAGVALQPGAD